MLLKFISLVFPQKFPSVTKRQTDFLHPLHYESNLSCHVVGPILRWYSITSYQTQQNGNDVRTQGRHGTYNRGPIPHPLKQVMRYVWYVFWVKLTVIHIVSIPTARYHHWFISTIGMKYHLSSLNQNFLYQGSEILDLLNPSHSWWQHNAWILMLIHHWTTRYVTMELWAEVKSTTGICNYSAIHFIWCVFLKIHKIPVPVADKLFFSTLCQKFNQVIWVALFSYWSGYAGLVSFCIQYKRPILHNALHENQYDKYDGMLTSSMMQLNICIVCLRGMLCQGYSTWHLNSVHQSNIDLTRGISHAIQRLNWW